MRVFQDVREAYSEITRDLAKSPVVVTKRVQNKIIEGTAHEAMNYSYAIHSFPEDLGRGPLIFPYLDLGEELGIIDADDRDRYYQWLTFEASARVAWQAANTTELYHPALTQLLEGQEPSYTYGDRLFGMVDVLSDTVSKSPDTRRAYWPMYNHEDSIRASRFTRVPCTLGYQVSVREVNGIPMLHMTYIERSCDFKTFWFTDLFLARYLQWAIWCQISPQAIPGLEMGPLTHIVLSFHTFIDQEIY